MTAEVVSSLRLKTEAFDFELPREAIAARPAAPRDAVIGNGEHPTRRRDRCGGVAIHEERAHEARAGARVGSTTARFGQ